LWQAWQFSVAIAFPSPPAIPQQRRLVRAILVQPHPGGAGVAETEACEFPAGMESLAQSFWQDTALKHQSCHRGRSRRDRSWYGWCLSIVQVLVRFGQIRQPVAFLAEFLCDGLPSPSGNTTGFGAGGTAAEGEAAWLQDAHELTRIDAAPRI